MDESRRLAEPMLELLWIDPERSDKAQQGVQVRLRGRRLIEPQLTQTGPPVGS